MKDDHCSLDMSYRVRGLDIMLLFDLRLELKTLVLPEQEWASRIACEEESFAKRNLLWYLLFLSI